MVSCLCHQKKRSWTNTAKKFSAVCMPRREFDTKGPCLHKKYLLSTDMLPNELFSNSLLRQSLRRAFSNLKMSFTERILVAGRSWSLISPISHKDRCCQLGPMDKEIEEVRHQHFFCNSCCIRINVLASISLTF